VTTLVICLDRAGDVPRKAGVEPPVVGREAVRALVTDVGLVDPEDSSVNCMLRALCVANERREAGEAAVVAVLSGAGDSLVGADRSVAAQLDDLVAAHDPDSAVVVLDSAEDERLVPVVESRLPVDAVDRVVVRQARDIESTYYLLKQFLADEELRSTVLVPLGVGLLLFPLLLFRFSTAVAVAGLAALLGASLLYKGLAVDDRLADAGDLARNALYSGQVSVVTYVAAAGLALVGASVGVLAASDLSADASAGVPAAQFLYRASPWLALAALTASTGRLLDELIGDSGVSTPYLHLPFGIVALGLVVRGFTGYFLEREGVLDALVVRGVTVLPVHRLAAFVVAGIVVSAVGVRFSTTVSDERLEEAVE
jgi:putative membrane protein